MTRFRLRMAAAAMPFAVAAIASSSALAAPAQYTPREVCGAEYHVVKSTPIDGFATIYVLRRPDGGYCATVIKRKNIGSPNHMRVLASLRGSRGPDVEGNYTHYAGPIRFRKTGRFPYVAGSYWGGPQQREHFRTIHL